MFSFDGICPHCGSEKGFNAFGVSAYVISDRDYEQFPLTPMEQRIQEAREGMNLPAMRTLKDQQLTFTLAGECRRCHMPVLATCIALGKDFLEICQCISKARRATYCEPRIIAFHPAPVPPYAHPSLPEDVRHAFIDLQSMLREKKMPHFILTGCRAVLEAAVRHLGGGKDGDALYARIADLFDKGIITASLKDWASVVRRYGNAAAHEMKGSPEEAREMVDFTRVFLQFTFELPSTIEKIRSRAE